jgi:hypothetical protein
VVMFRPRQESCEEKRISLSESCQFSTMKNDRSLSEAG